MGDSDSDSGGPSSSGSAGYSSSYSQGMAGGGGYGADSNGMATTNDIANSYYGPGFDIGVSPSYSYSPDSSFTDMQGFGSMTGDANDSYGQGYNGNFADTDGTLSKVFKHPLTQFMLARANPAYALAAKAYGLYSAANSPSKAGGLAGSTLGGGIGQALGGPVGGIAGAYAGGKAGGYAGANSGGDAGAGVGGAGHGGGNLSSEMLAGLGSLYAGRNADRSSNKQIGNLQGLYAPGGAYANQLRQTLERKDAAGGRRSQYGPREADLMARLADRAAQTAPQMQNLYTQRDENRANMLRSGLASYDRIGGYNGIKQGIGNLYQGGQDVYNSLFG